MKSFQSLRLTLRYHKKLNIKLPEAKPPVGSYVATKKVGNLLYISGQISISENGELIKGKIGKDLSVDDGYKAAERCGLSIISQAKAACPGGMAPAVGDRRNSALQWREPAATGDFHPGLPEAEQENRTIW